LNRYFVPVYISNEDYGKTGSAPAEEKAERNRIWRDAARAKLSSGTVHVYVLSPDGEVIDSQHVARASKVEELTALLERAVATLRPEEGKPLVPPACQSAAPSADRDALVLHLTERNLVRQGNEYVPVKPALGQNRAGGWGSYAAEDWIVLGKDEWRALLPAGEAKVGTSWDLDQAASAKVLRHFYPSTENNNVATNRIEEQALKATVLAVEGDGVRARIDGRLKMKHTFYHKDDNNFVEATVVGYLEFEPGRKRIRTLQLATDQATYGRSHFGVVVQSISE
jgi:hypothetical protein